MNNNNNNIKKFKEIVLFLNFLNNPLKKFKIKESFIIDFFLILFLVFLVLYTIGYGYVSAIFVAVIGGVLLCFKYMLPEYQDLKKKIDKAFAIYAENKEEYSKREDKIILKKLLLFKAAANELKIDLTYYRDSSKPCDSILSSIKNKIASLDFIVNDLLDTVIELSSNEESKDLERKEVLGLNERELETLISGNSITGSPSSDNYLK